MSLAEAIKKMGPQTVMVVVRGYVVTYRAATTREVHGALAGESTPNLILWGESTALVVTRMDDELWDALWAASSGEAPAGDLERLKADLCKGAAVAEWHLRPSGGRSG